MLFRLLCLCALFLSLPAWSQEARSADHAPARQLWQLLDYVAVDYSGAVGSGGVITSEAEYAEMREFTGSAVQQAQALPSHPSKEPLQRSIEQLRSAVQQKADAQEVARLAKRAGELLLAAYPIPVAPKGLPDLQRGAVLYQAHCASCHGATGGGDGPLAARLDPPPIAFTDAERARSRSVMALYQVVSQGVDGTSMPSFATLPESDRWALAFFISTQAHDEAARARGARQWQADSAVKARFGDLASLTTATEAGLAETMPTEAAHDLLAYLRRHPEAVSRGDQTHEGLALARLRLSESLAAAQAGDTAGATRLALSAYLDGFEPLEPALEARDKALLAQVESGMMAYRAALAAGRLDEAQAEAQRLDRLFARVGMELEAGPVSFTATFLGGLTILLREGVEALLIIIGMIAFLKKAERPDVLRHVHAGWMAALAAGGLTWLVATRLIDISGTSREVTEGLSSLLAALVLLSVGLWMHEKSTAGRWQDFLKQKLSAAMSRGSAWALFGLAFIAVYREVFETVLFYSALWRGGDGSALLAGLLVGVLLLSVLAWVMMRTSARMPIGRFFAMSSLLVAGLATVLAGKGAAALQEAGWLGVRPISWPHIEMLGMYPSIETMVAQLVVLAVALLGFARNAVTARRPRVAWVRSRGRRAQEGAALPSCRRLKPSVTQEFFGNASFEPVANPGVSGRDRSATLAAGDAGARKPVFCPAGQGVW